MCYLAASKCCKTVTPFTIKNFVHACGFHGCAGCKQCFKETEMCMPFKIAY